MSPRSEDRRPRRTPVVLVTGIGEDVMAALMVALQWDLPAAVSVRHEIDPERELLIRTVADVDGLIERIEINVEHACVSCAIREDVVPTLERLAASGRWSAVIAQLPVTAEATQVCRYLEFASSDFPHVAITAAIVALDADRIRHDLLGDDLLTERGLPVRPQDDRGVAEVACAMVEYADLVAVSGPVAAAEAELMTAIARPDVTITESARIDASTVLAGLHRHADSEAWVHVVRRDELTIHPSSGAWVLDFRSDRPFHPQRLRDRIETLGRGPRRSRGCFWLPSRPGQVCQWDGAGGLVSIGTAATWKHAEQLTRIVIVGMDDQGAQLADAFESCLLTDAELADRGQFWDVAHDGLEPWLGPVPDLMDRRP